MLSAFRPPLFLMTALVWLGLSLLLGLYMLGAKAAGWPVIPTMRIIHVHMALVGGVAQMIFGALLTFIPPLLMVPFEPKKTRFFQYLLLNGGTLGNQAGFGTANLQVVGYSGMAVALAFLLLLADTIEMVNRSLSKTGLNMWFYGIAVVALLGGIGLGATMAFGAFTPETVNLARLAHLHLNLIGFVTLTIVGTMHNLFPTVTSTRLYSDRLALTAFLALPVGALGVVGGFLLVKTWLLIAGGGLLLLGACAYGWNILRTWLTAESRFSLPVLHLLCGTGWLIFAITAGVWIAWNDRTTPPIFPIGTAHLIGYSHMALVGFILQTIMGALSHLLPVILTLNRVKSQKKRRPYLDSLTGLIERVKWVQLAALNLGTAGIIGWGLFAGLFGLQARPTIAILWVSIGLLLAALLIFGGKIGLLLASRPEE
jgi:hypothetical protein